MIALNMFKAQEYNADELQNMPITASHRALSTSYFTYVARSRETGKASLVNKLQLLSEEESLLFQQKKRKVDQDRKKAKENVVDHNDSLLEKLVEAGSVLEDMPALAHPNAVLMRATTLENSLVCQPQNVNTAGRVFGGYISEYIIYILPRPCFLVSPIKLIITVNS
jgi:acyl-CoA hydrolase